MLVAAVSADTAFLQMKMKAQVKAPEDFTYGEDGAAEDALDNSPTLGVHEFLEAQSDDVVDGDDSDDAEARLAAANDEVTNFGQDTDGQSYDEEVDEDVDELDAE